MLEAVFWLSAILVFWTYLGYPMAMGALAFVRPAPIEPRPRPGAPTVTVVLAVRDEASRLEHRVDNLLAQTGLISAPQIVIAYNGCTDNTPLIARSLAQRHPHVEALGSPGEEGKAGALNRGVEAATGEIIIFADGRQMFAADTIQRLLEPYTDPNVGAVSGRLIILETDVPAVGGVGTYWKLESWLRDSESRSGSVVGSTGAVHSVRKELYGTLPPGLILDDVMIPMNVVMQGFRAVRVNNAVAWDVPAPSSGTEFRRKLRTLVGNLQLVQHEPKVLSPGENPLFFRFVSHKLLRLVAPLLLLTMLVAAIPLSQPFYRGVLAAQVLVYVLGVLGLLFPIRVLSLPAGFVLLNGAALAAILKRRSDASAIWHGTSTPTPWTAPDPVELTSPAERREAS
ncbi:MAG: glycosyltransferase [Gemmatimonadetes bacterium]|nr:glycosyltransferase [Gemmatimonadota bacterium]NNM35219.1 glycosyltransferase [Gemmatimonadota bacterium]